MPAENWDAVAKAIDTRLKEMGWRQRDLVERSKVSPAIVREIHRNTVNRQRSQRTLEALSLTLNWHPGHLDAVLHGQEPPRQDERPEVQGGDLASRLDRLEGRLEGISARLDSLSVDVSKIIEHLVRKRDV